MNKTTAILTAKWWRNKLECNHHNNGDSSCDIAGILADLLAAKNKPQQMELEIFELELIKLIMDYNSDTLYLRCDYGPCDMLAKAAAVAEINTSVFPWKTSTITTGDKVSVSDGYGEPYEEISLSDFYTVETI